VEADYEEDEFSFDAAIPFGVTPRKEKKKLRREALGILAASVEADPRATVLEIFSMPRLVPRASAFGLRGEHSLD
jgi:hypothetical protein